jgi:diguanylate cyclase (GGDEF)-like protein
LSGLNFVAGVYFYKCYYGVSVGIARKVRGLILSSLELSIVRCWLLLCCLFGSVKIVAEPSQAILYELSEPYSAFAKQVIFDPATVVAELELMQATAPSDALRAVQYHFILANAYYSLTYPKKALSETEAALILLDADQQPWLYHSVKVIEAMAYDSDGQSALGLPGVNAAIAWAQKKQLDKLTLQALFARGMLQISLADYVSALSDLQQAYELASNDPHSLSKAHVAAMIAQVYEYRSENEMAIPFFTEAVAAHRQHDAQFDLSVSLYGLGKANANLGRNIEGARQLEESLAIAKQVGDEQGVAYALKELASIDIRNKQFAQAEEKILQASLIFTQAENQQMLFNLRMALVDLSIKDGQLSKAKRYLEQAEVQLDRQTMPVHSISFDEMAAKLNALQGQFQPAYHQLAQAFTSHRKYQSEASTQQLHQLRARFELQYSQQENQVLAQQNAIVTLQLAQQKSQNIQLLLLSIFAFVACVLLGVLVLRNKKHKQRLERLATTDELTGLCNRRHILAMLEHQMMQASRYQQSLTIAMLDLDWFKQINDAYGHHIGDKVLVSFAQTCKHTLRESDQLGRIGGEEFLLLLHHTSATDAQTLLEKLQKKVADIGPQLAIATPAITFTAGVVAYQHDDNMEDLLQLADLALYRGKKNGRNQIVLCERIPKAHTTELTA